MTTSTTMKRRMIVGAFLAVLLTIFFIIFLAGFGRIPPEPTLSIIGFLSGALTLSILTWNRARSSR